MVDIASDLVDKEGLSQWPPRLQPSFLDRAALRGVGVGLAT